MCHYQTLYHDDQSGYVIRCAECEKIQIGFSTVLLTFGVEDFHSFRCWLTKIREEQHPAQNPNMRCIIIPMPCEGIRLLLSLRELKELERMLEEAATELQSLALLKLFDV